MFICCALFLYLWYGINPTVRRDHLALMLLQFFPPFVAVISRIYVLGAGH